MLNRVLPFCHGYLDEYDEYTVLSTPSPSPASVFLKNKQWFKQVVSTLKWVARLHRFLVLSVVRRL